VNDRSTSALDAWLASLSRDSRRELYVLLDELVFGCSLEQLKDAVAATLGADAVKRTRARSPLEALRDRVRRRGHPDFR
jgi:hypothetical protein